jgi:hypothetical protein
MYIRGFARTLLPILGKGRADRKNQAVNLRKKEGPTVQRKKTFLVVCLSILMAGTRAQQPGPVPVEKIVPGHLVFTKLSLVSGLSLPAVAGQYLLAGGTASPKRPLPPFHVPDMAGYYPAVEPLYMGTGSYYDQLGFFCKRELDIQKTTHLPVFFRLGSLESCNKLEGK